MGHHGESNGGHHGYPNFWFFLTVPLVQNPIFLGVLDVLVSSKFQQHLFRGTTSLKCGPACDHVVAEAFDWQGTDRY